LETNGTFLALLHLEASRSRSEVYSTKSPCQTFTSDVSLMSSRCLRDVFEIRSATKLIRSALLFTDASASDKDSCILAVMPQDVYDPSGDLTAIVGATFLKVSLLSLFFISQNSNSIIVINCTAGGIHSLQLLAE